MATMYSQKDEKWAELKLGKTSLKMKDSGCFVVSLASMLEQSPGITLEALNRGECFNEQGMLLSDKAVSILKMRYKGKTKNQPPDKDLPCIAETNYYEDKGYPQHFFVFMGKQIMDPLDGKTKANLYPIVSYRLFKVKKVELETVYPARPPEPDISPIAEAEDKLKELSSVIDKAARAESKKLTLWEWIKNFLFRIFRAKT